MSFSFLYYDFGDIFSEGAVGECICNQFYFLIKCIYGLYLLIKDKTRKKSCHLSSVLIALILQH